MWNSRDAGDGTNLPGYGSVHHDYPSFFQTAGRMNFNDADVYQVTLVGPAHFGPQSPLLSLLPWTKPEWRRLTVELQVGTDYCPDFEHLDLCLTAIEELMTMADGLLSDEVIDAIRTHLPIVSFETFKGPPTH